MDSRQIVAGTSCATGAIGGGVDLDDEDDVCDEGDIPLAARLGIGGQILLWGVIFAAAFGLILIWAPK